MEYFKNIQKIQYEGADSKNPLSFRFYNPDEIVGGKTMREQLRFAMSYWHTMCAGGTDMFGSESIIKSYGAQDAMEIAKNKAYASFELMDKLGIDYFCFHDRDIAPEGTT
ncbi:MAG: xylose isomerase, partial [Clostridia bacterium]|nr:xylose isomerase [Clostridia bacterium]